MMKNKQTGFTLVELLVTVLIIGIMAAIALPNMRDFINNTRISNRTDQIANLMRFAKAEAVRRNMPVIICGTAIRSDGRPSGNCNANKINEGWRVFADVDRNGTYDGNVDTELRTISINGNSTTLNLNVEPTVYAMTVSSGTVSVSPVSDSIKQYVFMPDGAFGRKTVANSLQNLVLSQNYVRFVVSEGDMTAADKRVHAKITVVNPSGKVSICNDVQKSSYEAPTVCTL